MVSGVMVLVAAVAGSSGAAAAANKVTGKNYWVAWMSSIFLLSVAFSKVLMVQ